MGYTPTMMSKTPLVSALALALLSGGLVLADPPAAAPPPDAAAPAPTADTSAPDLAKQLADVQDKLSTALHSYSLLQDENAQLKAAADAAAADKAGAAAQLDAAQRTNDSLKAQAAVATQVDGLRDQLRQSQNELAALAEENAQLRTRLALAGPAPGSLAQAPTRPGADAAVLTPVPALTPVPPAAKSAPAATATPDAGASRPAAAAPAPAAASGPRTYVVVAGDSLGKISRKFYGSAMQYEKIVAANRGVIKDENHVEAGMTLTIP
jgi:nucleoid-associated protein YgaU